MSIGIKKKLTHFLQTHQKVRQWAWFVLLWCGGLLSCMAIAFSVKMLINLQKHETTANNVNAIHE